MRFDVVKKVENEQHLSTYKRLDVCFTHGKGCKLYDGKNKEYTDFMSGIAVNCLGYNDAELTEAIKTQAEKLIHISNNFYIEAQSELVQNLLKGSDFEKMFLCNSGTESLEAAIKLARKYFFDSNRNKFKFITAKDSFHGRTMGSLTLTGQPKLSNAFRPLLNGAAYVPFNDVPALKSAIEDETCAIVLEVIQGEAGIIPATQEYIKAAEKLARENNLLLIIDEVQTGMGRCGKMFAYQNYGIKPDIITLAKSLGGGMPIGAVLVSGKLANTFKYGDHGSTFGGNPLACAAANVIVKRLKTPEFLNEINAKGKYLMEKLNSLNYDFIEEPRGMGLMVGLPLDNKIEGRSVVEKMLEKGFVLNCTHSNALRFMPPYIISYDEINKMIKALNEVFKELSNAMPHISFLNPFPNMRNL